MIHLQSERLDFRDHELSDLDAYAAFESDPIYRSPQPVHPREEIERGFGDGWMIAKPMGLRATVIRATGEYIGRCGLYPMRDDADRIVAGEAHVAYYIGRPYWGQGYATEAAAAFVAHGFEHLGLVRIVAGINARNTASLRVVEKLGFRLARSGGEGGTRWHDFEISRPRS